MRSDFIRHFVYDPVNGGRWCYGVKRQPRKRVGILYAFRPDGDPFARRIDVDAGARMVRQALDHLTRLGALHAAVNGAGLNPTVQLCLVGSGLPYRAFSDRERREIPDQAALVASLERAAAYTSLLCEPPDNRLSDPVWLSFALNGPAAQPFHFMEFGADRIVRRIVADKPNHSRYAFTKRYVPGDEARYHILVGLNGEVAETRQRS